METLVRVVIFTLLLQPSLLLGQKYVPAATPSKADIAHAFSPEDVQLLDGPFKVSQDAGARNLRNLNVDRLLAPYLIEAGLKPKAAPYGGWETDIIPGAVLSFYLSGMSRLYMSTRDSVYGNRIEYALNELERCQRNTGGYIMGVRDGRQLFRRIEKEGCYPGFGFFGNGDAAPYYSLEKLFSGLRDVYRLTHNPKALTIAVALGNWLVGHMSHINDVELQKLMRIEYGGMNWVLSDLYADTGDKRFLQLSKRWQDSITVVPMVNGTDALDGVHANMQFPKFSGLAARYPYSGDSSDLFGATFFWDAVVNHRTYATGGNSESEFFGPRDSLSTRLTPFTEENCNEYNMLRLTSLLFEIEPKIGYADYMERTLFNHLLSAQNIDNGKVCYHLPLMSGAEKYFQPFENFTCCTVSGLDSYTRQAEYIYFHTSSRLYVNLFIASRLHFSEKAFSLVQETKFPEGDLSTLKVHCPHPVTLELCIRNPYWSGGDAVVILVNGKGENSMPGTDGYIHLVRAWKEGDVVQIKLPMHVRSEHMPDDSNRIALFYGPILLAADLDTGVGNALVEERVVSALVPENAPIGEWLKPTGEPLTFVTTIARPKQVRLKPFYLKKYGSYTVYWQLLSGNQWSQREELFRQMDLARKEVEERTIDRVDVADSGSKQKHGLTGVSYTGYGNTGILMDRFWRTSYGKAFGYQLAIDDSTQNTLYFRFMGRDSYEHWNCRITVDGMTIDTLSRGKDDRYTTSPWETTYFLPATLLKGKKAIRVMFEKIGDKDVEMPRLMEIRTLKG